MSIKDQTASSSHFISNQQASSLPGGLEQAFPELANDTSDEWHALVNSTSPIELPADMEIMNPMSPCEQFFLIMEGSIRVYQQTSDDREATVYRLSPGDLCILGINALLRRKSYGAFARSETELKCLVFNRQQFFDAMAISEAFRSVVLLSMSDRFNDMLGLMETTVFDSLETRLVCMLSKMSRVSDTDNIHITHQEIARELGTSREVISRILKGLERKGCIELSRGQIKINM